MDNKQRKVSNKNKLKQWYIFFTYCNTDYFFLLMINPSYAKDSLKYTWLYVTVSNVDGNDPFESHWAVCIQGLQVFKTSI